MFCCQLSNILNLPLTIWREHFDSTSVSSSVSELVSLHCWVLPFYLSNFPFQNVEVFNHAIPETILRYCKGQGFDKNCSLCLDRSWLKSEVFRSQYMKVSGKLGMWTASRCTSQFLWRFWLVFLGTISAFPHLACPLTFHTTLCINLVRVRRPRYRHIPA